MLGAFSSAIFLYGIALVYGATGTTSLTGIDTFLRANTLFEPGTLLAGIVLLLVGLGFKVAAVPFHMWTPDVYQGAPTPVTAFMASATKVAAFAALLRIFDGAFLSYRDEWQPVVWALTVLTLARRQHRRAAPGRPEAAARVLVDRARRLPADGAGDRHPQGP